MENEIKIQFSSDFNIIIPFTITGYGMDDGAVGDRVRTGSRIVTSQYHPYRFWDPSRLLYNGYQRLFPPGIKHPRRKAHHSATTSAQVEVSWLYTSTPPFVMVS
jgi:hypothetical protein